MELYLARPLGLSALLLPLAVLLLARRRRPESEPTGTVAVWREVAPREPQAGGRRRRLPPGLLLLLTALSLGSLALAGPRAGARAGRSWHLMVDGSPSMQLPHQDGGTRRERALARAEDWLAGVLRAEDRVLRSTWDGVPSSSLDRAGVLWVTDRAPADPPRRAGLFASGGRAVPGPIAVGRGELLRWDGESVVRAPAPRRAVRLDAAVPGILAGLVRLWAATRGLDVAGAPDRDEVLHLGSVTGAGPLAEVRAGRDGWTAAGRLAGDPLADSVLVPWLTAEGRTLVAAGPGIVRVAWTELDEPWGDPDAFAVSWSRLLDASLAPPPGIVPLEERLDAGGLWSSPGDLPGREGGVRGAGVDAVLALMAAGCGLLALGLRV